MLILLIRILRRAVRSQVFNNIRGVKMDMSAIQKRIDLLEKYQEEVKNAKEMLNGELENSLEYIQATEEAKEAAEKRKKIKEEILAAGPNQKLVADIKSNTEEINTLKEILSAELIEVYQENKSDIFNDSNGEPRKFKVSVRLLPKRVSYESRDSFGKYTEE